MIRGYRQTQKPGGQPVTAYRFHLVCPNCGKTSETVATEYVPQPRVNCGDCLMNRVEVIEMKVAKTEPVS